MLQVGLQLYSVRNHMAADWRKTLTEIAGAGYRYIEPANHAFPEDDGIGFGVPAKEMKKLLDDSGLQVCSCHVFPLDTLAHLSELPRVLDYQREIGSTRIVNAMSFFPSGDDTRRLCEVFNKMGEVCKTYGMDFMYHNHFHEFQVLPGETETVFDILLAETDPDLVKIELDTYWTARGNVNPKTFIRHLGDRLLMLHQKDFPASCTQPLDLLTPVQALNIPINNAIYDFIHTSDSFTEIGSGTLAIQSYIDAANIATSADYIILEQDFTAMDEIESIKKSMAGFRKFAGIQW